MEKARDLVKRLSTGPSVLLLGSNYLRLENGIDPLLSAILTKYGGDLQASSYLQVFETRASTTEHSIAWIHERSRGMITPGWLKTVAEFPWSAVYTSAIDAVWLEAFRNSWRSIQPVFDEKYRSADPRNRLTLHATFLFGCLSQVEEDQRPPFSRFEWRKRRHVAVSLARGLAQLVTPLGSLVIEGYGGISDLLSPEDLCPILDEFNPGQVHFFSPQADLLEDPDFGDLVKQEKVVVHKEQLHSLFSEAIGRGLLAIEIPTGDRENRRVFINGEAKVVPTAVWNQASKSALILNESTGRISMEQVSEDESYQQFRSFLATADGIPNWSGFAKGFAFRRHFENDLHERVEKKLAFKQWSDEPIILHGQTGTGKSVALSAMAFSIKEKGVYPVLFIERRIARPNPMEIDAFCRWAETEGGIGCLVIWDGMVEPDQYLALLKDLVGRGRRVVLVGSCYRLPDEYHDRRSVIPAPTQLTEGEVREFGSYLARFQSYGETFITKRLMIDGTFLSALYRLLPPTRRGIRVGVTKEVDHAEQALRKLTEDIKPEIETALGAALRVALQNAGLPESIAPFQRDREMVGDELVTELQELTGLVAVPGQFGLSQPFELLMRTLGRRTSAHFLKLLGKVDIFRWGEDAEGNIEVGPRNALEAQLIVESRMGGAKTETAFAERLLFEVRDAGAGIGSDNEVNFAVDLLRKMGSTGVKKAYFMPYFKELARTLRRLREERGVENPRLMLQEANLLREYEKAHSSFDERTVDERSQELCEIGEVLERALEKVDKGSPTRTFLLVELASALSTRALALRDRPQEAIKYFEEARDALRKARINSPTNYYPIDVASWATRDMLQLLSEKQRMEALADLFNMFQTANPTDFDIEQQEKFHSRRLQWGELLKKEDLSESAFSALEAQGSTAGYYVRAYLMSQLPRSARDLTNDDIKYLDSALHYLQENRGKFANDARCLDLMLDLWWLVHAQSRLFEHERTTLALTREELLECLDIVLTLEHTGESQRAVIILFLRALIVFHLGDIEQSIELFRLVESESFQIRGMRRVVKSYLASNADGTPKKYHGTVAWVSPQPLGERRGEVYVEDLRRRISFFPREFHNPDIVRGTALDEFHIAFNFLGPLADPVEWYKGSHLVDRKK